MTKDKTWWRVLHAFAFLLGGITYIVGSDLAYVRDSYEDNVWVGINYLVGSCGFLVVDTMEFFTFTEDKDSSLRRNIAVSMLGSALYVIGSVGFFPYFDDGSRLYDGSDALGVYGFIFGSVAIGLSELWKLQRINRTPEGLWGSQGNTALTITEVMPALMDL